MATRPAIRLQRRGSGIAAFLAGGGLTVPGGSNTIMAPALSANFEYREIAFTGEESGCCQPEGHVAARSSAAKDGCLRVLTEKKQKKRRTSRWRRSVQRSHTSNV